MTLREPPLPPPYLPREVAAMFRVNMITLNRWRRAGKITAIPTPGGQYRYPRDTTDALLAARTGGKR